MYNFTEIEKKKIIASIRGADFVHAGEKKALDLILKNISQGNIKSVLDVGCGLGGSADYIQKKLSTNVTAFDIDKEAIAYAKSKYSDVNFILADVINSDKVFSPKKFDLILLINSMVKFSRQEQSLNTLSALIERNGILVIFEYTDLTSKKKNELIRKGSNDFFQPLPLDMIKTLLNDNGWILDKLINLNAEYRQWYKDFLYKTKLYTKQTDKIFGEGATEFIYDKFYKIHSALEKKILGGALIIAKPQ